jgi:hypothetical protein
MTILDAARIGQFPPSAKAVSGAKKREHAEALGLARHEAVADPVFQQLQKLGPCGGSFTRSIGKGVSGLLLQAVGQSSRKTSLFAR